MGAPPAGTVTFLFTGIEESTQLSAEAPETMRPALGRHDALLLNAEMQRVCWSRSFLACVA
jgi:hypothetical protein